MRTEYGKLLYMLQDAVSSELEELLGNVTRIVFLLKFNLQS